MIVRSWLAKKGRFAAWLVLLLAATVTAAHAKPLATAKPPALAKNLSAQTGYPAVEIRRLAAEIAKSRDRVFEFKMIREAARELGLRVWLFGGTAAGFAHYVKWDLLRKDGDKRFIESRFDYDFTNIYRSTQDADLVVDGTPEQAERLEELIKSKFAHLQGSKSEWEVRLLRQDRGAKQALLNNPDFLDQHTDSNSTGMIELTDPPGGESAVRDLRDWKNQRDPFFLRDAAEGRLHYYFSKRHETTSRFKAGDNPPIFSVIRYFTKAFQYELGMRDEDLVPIREIIGRFDPARDPASWSGWARGWLADRGNAAKLVKHAVNIEYAMNTLDTFGLRKKLAQIGDINEAGSVAWWMGKEPLRSYPVGDRARLQKGTKARTIREIAKERGIPWDEFVVAHETFDFIAYESITRDTTGRPNVLISRDGYAGEAAAFGDGHYTKVGRQGAAGTGLTIRYKVAPEALEGADFLVGGRDFLIFLNRNALEVIPESLNIGPVEFFMLLQGGELLDEGDRGILEKLKRRIANKSAHLSDGEDRAISGIVRGELHKRKPSLFVLEEWLALPHPLKHLELSTAEKMRAIVFTKSNSEEETKTVQALLRRFAKKAANPANQAAFAEAFIDKLMGIADSGTSDAMVSILFEFPFIRERMSPAQWFDLLFLGGISIHNYSVIYPAFRKAAIEGILAASGKEKLRLRARLIGAMERGVHINPNELDALFRTELGAVFWDEKFFTSLLLGGAGTRHSLLLAGYTHHPYQRIDSLAPFYARFVPKEKLKEMIFSRMLGTTNADDLFTLWIALPFADEFAAELEKKILKTGKLPKGDTHLYGLIAEMFPINPKTARLYLSYGGISGGQLLLGLSEPTHVREAYRLAQKGQLGSIKPDDLFFSDESSAVLKDELKARIRQDLRGSRSPFLSRLLDFSENPDVLTGIDRALLELIDESGGEARAKLLRKCGWIFLKDDLPLVSREDSARLIVYVDELVKGKQREPFSNFVQQKREAIVASPIASTVMDKLIEAAAKIGSDVDRGRILLEISKDYEASRFPLLRKALQEFGQNVHLFQNIDFTRLATGLNADEKKVVFDWLTTTSGKYDRKYDRGDWQEHIEEFMSAEWSAEELEARISKLVQLMRKLEYADLEGFRKPLHSLLLELDPGKTIRLTPVLAEAYLELLSGGGAEHFNAEELRLLRAKGEVPLIRDFVGQAKALNGYIDVDGFIELLKTKYGGCARILKKKKSWNP